MFSYLKSMTVKGGGFREKTVLTDILSDYFNIVYGPNGSGKTSLSRAIYHFAQNDGNADYSCEFDKEIPEELRKNIRVYNEDYIDKNVKLVGDGLNTIVMLGENIEIEREISETDNFHKNIIKEYNVAVEKQKEFDNEEISVRNQYFSSISNSNWADRYNRMFDNPLEDINIYVEGVRSARNHFVHDHDYVLRIFGTVYPQAIAKHVEDDLYIYGKIKNGFQITRQDINNFKNWIYLSSRAVAILSFTLNKNYEKPSIDSTIQLRNDLVIAGEQLLNLTSQIASVGLKTCPVCHQPISVEKMTELGKLIHDYLNTDVERQKKRMLGALKRIQQLFGLIKESPFYTLFEDRPELEKLKKVIEVSGNVLESMVNKKLENIYENDFFEKFGKKYNFRKVRIKEIQNVLNEMLSGSLDSMMSGLVKRYLIALEDFDSFFTGIIEENNILGYLENRYEVEEYNRICEAKKRQQNEVQKLVRQVESSEIKLAQLKKALVKSKPAMDKINMLMDIVFFCQDRLHLEMNAEGRYILYSRRKKVKPSEISTGERNILALAYYLASISIDSKNNGIYMSPNFLVIDDPISSFDKGNYAGIISILHQQITELVCNNVDTKVLFLSHDLQTIEDLKALSKIVDYSYRKKYPTEGNAAEAPVYDLSHRCFMYESNNRNKSNYQIMLEKIYSFVNKKEDCTIEYEVDAIGNQMRQVLETFARVIYNKNYPALMSNIHYQNKISNPKLKNQINAAVFQIILNTESHAARSNSDDIRNERYTPNELRNYAKMLLMYMYSINSDHVYCFLGKDRVDNIKKWINAR